MSDSAERQFHERLVRLVGLPFVAFICGVSETALLARLQTGKGFSLAQNDVLDEALSVALESAKMNLYYGGGERGFLQPLARFDDEAGTSRAVALRIAAGGTVPSVSSSDTIEGLLETLARDLYPLLLIEPPDTGFRRVGGRSLDRLSLLRHQLFWHPCAERFEKAVLASPLLVRLFPSESPSSGGRCGTLWTNLGRGGTIQSSGFADGLLADAYVSMLLDNAHDHSRFVSSALSQLQGAYKLAAGEPLQVRTLLGFVGVNLERGSLDTPWGSLRRPTESERLLYEDLPVADGSELVLATQVPMKIKIGPFDAEGGGWPAEPPDFLIHHELEQRAEVLALTLMLALDSDPPIGVRRTWTLHECPMVQSGPALSWFSQVGPLAAHSIRGEERRRIRRWAKIVSELDTSSLDVAIKRALSALANRLDPADRLIDSVVALESMFGHGSGELSFRVSAAAAYLLYSDASERMQAQAHIVKIYGMRSRLVHGGQPPKSSDLVSSANAASKYAVDCLRMLFRRYPELVGNNKRGTKLILGQSRVGPERLGGRDAGS